MTVPDTDRPGTSIKKGPPGRSHDRTPAFRFRSDEAGSTFVCRIGKKPFVNNPAVKTFHVKPGRHMVRVKATDVAGNADSTPAKRSFTVLRWSPGRFRGREPPDHLPLRLRV